ncbi:uncharacterized protein LOC143916297 [Arctopsyche grandis]|uniref:uncharacterized protein LOC143916297 n=1 Tax=Arctopsyche grandis TaxID=121162 RepID=UPI00406D7509
MANFRNIGLAVACFVLAVQYSEASNILHLTPESSPGHLSYSPVQTFQPQSVQPIPAQSYYLIGSAAPNFQYPVIQNPQTPCPPERTPMQSQMVQRPIPQMYSKPSILDSILKF